MPRCDECGANQAEYKLINGQEVDLLCEPCFKDTLFDLVKSNDRVLIYSRELIPKDCLEVYELG